MKHVPICDAGSSSLSQSVGFNPTGRQRQDVKGQRKDEHKRSNPGVAASQGRIEYSTHPLKFTLTPRV